MCTAVGHLDQDFYFGRTLDYHCSFGEEVVLTPRNFPLVFRDWGTLKHHYAIIGMAHVAQGYPLYYDGINELGLGMAGLNFVGNAHYGACEPGKENIAHFELVPWLLGSCGNVEEVLSCVERLRITDRVFSRDLPPAQLHWLIGDRNRAVVLEATREGVRAYDNPVGVLTNNPTFDIQMQHLNNYMQLSSKPPKNRFAPGIQLEQYSRGMGALGLPGDFSSQSRFVRAAFVNGNWRCGDREEERVDRFFQTLDSVAQPNGCCQTEEGGFEITIYRACCNASRGIYYYTTAGNRQITAVQMRRENLDREDLVRYGLILEQQIRYEGGE